MYKQLHDSLTIKFSGIEGFGLFAKKDIPEGTNFGVSHMKMNGMLIRTPLGGFINHSDTPNCTKSKYFMTQDYTRYDLVTLENIDEGEELTLKYTFYNIK